MATHKFVLCPECKGRGYISVEMESGREMGFFTCPVCKDSPRPGYIIKRIERKENESKEQ